MMPRGLLILLSGGGLAQIVTLLALPVLGRLYDPIAFGQLAAVMAIVSLATVLVHGRYQMAIPVSKSDEEASALLAIAILCSAILSFPVVSLIYLVVGRQPDGLSIWGLLLAATFITILSSLIDILAYWRSHRRRFKISAQNNVARSLTTAFSQILLAFTQTLGLLIGTVLGASIAALMALFDYSRHDLKQLRRPPLKELFAVALKHRSYPLFGVPQGWLAALSWNAMPLLLLRFGGTAVAGQYWIAYRLLVAPIALFNGAYRQATLPLLRGKDRTTARKLIVQHTLWVAAAGAGPLIILFLFGEQLFTIAMGPVWATAGVLASWLAVGILADLIKVPALCLLQSQGRQRRILVWEAIILVVRYAGAIHFLLNGDSVTAIAYFGCLGCIGWLVFCLIELGFPKDNASPTRGE